MTITMGKHPGPRFRGPARLLALVIVLSVAPPAAAAGPATGKLVVVLYPENNNGSPGNVLVEQGLRTTFATGSAEPIEVFSEYLDVSHVRDARDLRLQTEYLRQKYSGRKVDLVIAVIPDFRSRVRIYQEHSKLFAILRVYL